MKSEEYQQLYHAVQQAFPGVSGVEALRTALFIDILASLERIEGLLNTKPRSNDGKLPRKSQPRKRADKPASAGRA